MFKKWNAIWNPDVTANGHSKTGYSGIVIKKNERKQIKQSGTFYPITNLRKAPPWCPSLQMSQHYKILFF